MMTLDEAITYAEEVANKKKREEQKWDKWLESDYDHRAVAEKVSCKLCADEHRQLAEWLKDLKQLREQEHCEKAVSVQDCINAIENTDCELSPQAWKEITTSIMSLPPVAAPRKKGKWIEVDTNRYTCSNCSHCFTIAPEDNQIQEFNCCPNCRTEMEEVVQSDF